MINSSSVTAAVTYENGEFCKKQSEQKFNGRYCVVYLDKKKWASPLIDICGTKCYNKDEAEARIKKEGTKT